MRARSRSLGHAMKRGATALIRSIRHSTVAALRCKRKVLGRHRSRSGGGSGRALGEWFSEAESRFPAATGLGARRRGALRRCFFLAIEKPGPYSESSFGCKREIFSSSGDAGRRRRRGAVDDRIGERRATGLNALGRHLLVELFDCDPDVINNLEAVKGALIEAAKRAQATIVDVVFHEFNPFGISGVVVIAESHLSIHTWPEHRYAAVDIFSCGETLKPAEAAKYLVEQFGASRASCVEVKRGVFPGAAGLTNKVKEGVAADGATE